MSNFDNIYSYSQSYHKLIGFINTGQLTKFSGNHNFYMRLLLDALPKREYNFITEKNEIYSGIMALDSYWDLGINSKYKEPVNLIRAIYFFNNISNILRFSIGGDHYTILKDKYKLIDIEQLFKKYNLPDDINDIVPRELNIEEHVKQYKIKKQIN